MPFEACAYHFQDHLRLLCLFRRSNEHLLVEKNPKDPPHCCRGDHAPHDHAHGDDDRVYSAQFA